MFKVQTNWFNPELLMIGEIFPLSFLGGFGELFEV